jgi:hypothetical protein
LVDLVLVGLKYVQYLKKIRVHGSWSEYNGTAPYIAITLKGEWEEILYDRSSSHFE